MIEQKIENKNLKRASLIATVGSTMLLVLQIFSFIMYLISREEMARRTYDITKKSTPNFSQTFEEYQPIFMTTTIVVLVVFFAIVTLMLLFSIGLKKAKGRGKAITLVVLSAIFILFSLIGLSTGSLDSILTLVGYGAVFAGAILAISAPVSEYEYNRLD